jgi:hypothetical protein
MNLLTYVCRCSCENPDCAKALAGASYLHCSEQSPFFPGWPDWVNFSFLGDCLLREVFWKSLKELKFLYFFFSRAKVAYYFGQKMASLHFGRFFTNSSGHPVPVRIKTVIFSAFFTSSIEERLHVLRSNHTSPYSKFSNNKMSTDKMSTVKMSTDKCRQTNVERQNVECRIVECRIVAVC